MGRGACISFRKDLEGFREENWEGMDMAGEVESQACMSGTSTGMASTSSHPCTYWTRNGIRVYSVPCFLLRRQLIKLLLVFNNKGSRGIQGGRQKNKRQILLL